MNMKRATGMRGYFFVVLILMMIGLTGCNEFNVVNTYPANGAKAVELDGNIVVTFNYQLDASTVDFSTFVVKDNADNTLDGSITVNGTSILFRPISNLKSLTKYTVTVTSVLKETSGASLKSDYIFSFTTKQENQECLKVIQTTPVNEAKNVPLHTAISVTLSSNPDPRTVNQETLLVKDSQGKPVEGTISMTGPTIVFIPTSRLENLASYIMTVKSDFRDSNGISLCSDYSFSFTTGQDNPDCLNIIQTTPTDKAVDVTRDTAISVTFGSSIDSESVNSKTFIVQDSMSNRVEGKISTSGSIITFIPVPMLSSLEKYEVIIKSGVKVSNEFGLCSDYCFSLTTKHDPDCMKIIRTFPDNRDIDVAHDAAITAIFSEYINPETVNTGSITVRDTLNNPVEGEISVSGTMAVFKPASKLALYGKYSVYIKSDISNVYGTGLCTDYRYSFMTEEGHWGEAQPLFIDNTQNAANPKIASDQQGNAIAVWEQYDSIEKLSHIWSSRYTYGLGWTKTVRIDTGKGQGSKDPEIAVNPQGNAVVVWSQRINNTDGSFKDSVWANNYIMGTGWMMPQQIGKEGSYSMTGYEPRVAIDAQGNAIAIWADYNGTNCIVVNMYIADKGWGEPQYIGIQPERYPESEVRYPQIAMDRQGNAIAVWLEFNYQTGSQIRAKKYSPGRGWEETQAIVKKTLTQIIYPTVAVNQQGNILVAWIEDETIQNPWVGSWEKYNLWTIWNDQGCEWSKPESVDQVERDFYQYSMPRLLNPEIAFDPNGNALLVWQEFIFFDDNCTIPEVYLKARRYTKEGGWGELHNNKFNFPHSVWHEHDLINNGPAISIDQQGNAIVLDHQETHYDSSYQGVLQLNVFAHHYYLSSGWDLPRVIGNGSVFAMDAQVCHGPEGNAIAIWSQCDSDSNTCGIWTNTFE
jgi:hypothetical protein